VRVSRKMGLETCMQLLGEGAEAGMVIESCSEMGFLFGLLVMALLTLLVALYIYHALAWKRIAMKLGHKKPWLAWIPFASSAMRLQLGGFTWQWILLVLIPVLGWITLFVMLIIAHWRIFEKRAYPGWFALSQVIPEIGGILYFIAIGFVAWKDKTKKALIKTTKKVVKRAARKKAARIKKR